MELVEFLGVVVARRDIPVEIILVENFLNAVVFDERKFFCIESSDVLGGQIVLKGALFANGQKQLHKGFVNIVRSSLLCFCPKDAFQVADIVFEKIGALAKRVALRYHEVNVPQLGVLLTNVCTKGILKDRVHG